MRLARRALLVLSAVFVVLVAVAACGGSSNAQACRASSDCASGVCLDPPTAAIPGACTTDADCGLGQECTLDQAGAKKCGPTMCESNAECPANFRCATGTCQRTPCNADGACMGACVNGACWSNAGTCK